LTGGDATDGPFPQLAAQLAVKQANAAHLLGGCTLKYISKDDATVLKNGHDPAQGAANIAALETVVNVGDDMATVARSVPKLPTHWEILYESRLTQMIRSEQTPLPEGDVDASSLGPADVPEMLALVELTKPGPFRLRTIELGAYIGLRQSGRLMAMAGERLWIDDLREVSAVCTHPDVQGRGYARALMARVANGMLRAGQTPILHVESANKRAIDLYLALGFVRRSELSLLCARRGG